MEAAGIEPASEGLWLKASTCLADVSGFAQLFPHRQGHRTKLAQLGFRAPLPQAGSGLLARYMTPFPTPQARTGRTWLLYAASASSSLAVVFSHLFYEPMGPRHATFAAITPVETCRPRTNHIRL